MAAVARAGAIAFAVVGFRQPTIAHAGIRNGAGVVLQLPFWHAAATRELGGRRPHRVRYATVVTGFVEAGFQTLELAHVRLPFFGFVIGSVAASIRACPGFSIPTFSMRVAMK